MRSPAEFFDRVVSSVPELADMRSEHEREYGVLLGHLLMADMLRWACSSVADDPEPVDRLLAELASHLEPGDDPVSNIISVSFLEHLGAPGSPPQELAIRQRLPRALAEDLERMESWRPGR